MEGGGEEKGGNFSSGLSCIGASGGGGGEGQWRLSGMKIFICEWRARARARAQIEQRKLERHGRLLREGGRERERQRGRETEREREFHPVFDPLRSRLQV